MTEETKTNVVSINGKDYDANAFSNEQKYVIQQLRDLQTKADNLKFQADQLGAAQKMFTDTLIASIEATEEAPVEEAVVS